MCRKPGFTLIELLVVIAIVSIIAVLGMISLSNARMKSRDAKRVADIKQVQVALEMFYDTNSRYPTEDEWATNSLYSTSSIGTTTYIVEIPVAPNNADGSFCDNNNSSYYYSSNGEDYNIRACLGANIGTLQSGIIIASPDGSATCGIATVSDVDSNIYNTVQIGKQCWLKENLKTTRYNDRTEIANISSNSSWQNDTTGAYSWYNNDYDTYGSIYGALYNWHAVDTGNLCPLGWHVPTDNDLKILVEGQATSGCESSTGGQCSPAANLLKEEGTAHWTYSVGVTNASGFTALPGGVRDSDGSFFWIGDNTLFWSSTVSGVNAWNRAINKVSTLIDRNVNEQAIGMSVRCIKN